MRGQIPVTVSTARSCCLRFPLTALRNLRNSSWPAAISARLSSMRNSVTAIGRRGWLEKMVSTPRILPSEARTGALANESASSRRSGNRRSRYSGSSLMFDTTTGPSSASTRSKIDCFRGSSRTGSPQYDLTQKRLSSPNPSKTVSALKYSAARRVMASKFGSGAVSRIPVEARALSLASSSRLSELLIANSACSITFSRAHEIPTGSPME